MKRVVPFLLVLVCGCEPKQLSYQGTINSDVVYVRDYRTKLCFAVYGLGWNYGAMTNVPCSPEVEAQIAKNPSGAN